ncbi:MAG: COQ9 family protein, partial [Sphingomonadaceae bacterium]|nr:COQ9 family protein [Sphingomonadaceae bacterium]
DEMRAALAAELPRHAAFDGWSDAALARAAEATGIDPAVAALAFPGGAPDMIDAWFAHIDAAMLADLPPERLAAMKIRARIAALVEARLDLLAPDIEALRRALAVLALPPNLARAAKLGWRAADAMWRAAGDTATDYNHYSKRALLGGVYASTIMAMLDDDGDRLAGTRAFLGRRIEGIMRFEKFKARFSRNAPDRLSLARFLGRLRYPVV